MTSHAAGSGGGGSAATEQPSTQEAAAAGAAAAAAAGKDFSEAQAVLESRMCGSPAVDGYAHVEPPCLEASPTNKWWLENKPRPDDLDIFIEREADYDGLAGGRGWAGGHG